MGVFCPIHFNFARSLKACVSVSWLTPLLIAVAAPHPGPRLGPSPISPVQESLLGVKAPA